MFENIFNNITWFIDFFIKNFSVDWLIKFTIIYFFAIWFAFVIWVIKDITNRTTNILFHIIAVCLVVFLTPVLWLPIYFLIRPNYTLEEKYQDFEYEDTEENNENKLSNYFCYNCDYTVEKDFKFCPNCKVKLITECSGCKKEIQADWHACPYCWNEIEELKKETEKKVEENLNEIKEETNNEMVEESSIKTDKID